MTTGTRFDRKAKKCCATSHARLLEEMEHCDEMADSPTKWHRCARAASRRNSSRAKACMLKP